MLFIREVIEVHPIYRPVIFQNICSNFLEIKSHLVIRVALWIIGEYAETNEEIQQAFQTIKKNIGSLPIFPVVTEDLDIPTQ